jgi:hypothetical protein
MIDCVLFLRLNVTICSACTEFAVTIMEVLRQIYDM